MRRSFDKPVIRVKWVYKTKLNLDSTVQKNKARLVAKGYAQKPRIDFNETFTPVAKSDTIITLVALATQKKWKLFQLGRYIPALQSVVSRRAPMKQYFIQDAWMVEVS